jgi:phosphoglycerate kinase
MINLLKNLDVTEKRVLVRCDFNVPLNEKGDILDDFRIQQSLPTIRYLIEKGAKIILMSHLDPESTGVADKKFNLNNVGKKLSEPLDVPIIKIDDCIGPEAEQQSQKLNPGKILLLENLRFYKEETEADENFAKKLSFLGDIYVNDAFSVCHRNHASITGTPKFLESCAGLLLEKEVKILDKILKNPQRPMTTIVGGKKVETKAKFIEKILEVSDFVLVSGLIKKEIIEKNIKFNYPEKIIGPSNNLDALDIDQKTAEMFREKILNSKTVLWNGPFGKFEDEKFAAGTLALALAIIESGAFSVVGGGETIEFLKKQDMIQSFSHVSTGGGAMLNYLSGDELPGIKTLEK